MCGFIVTYGCTSLLFANTNYRIKVWTLWVILLPHVFVWHIQRQSSGTINLLFSQFSQPVFQAEDINVFPAICN